MLTNVYETSGIATARIEINNRVANFKQQMTYIFLICAVLNEDDEQIVNMGCWIIMIVFLSLYLMCLMRQ